ncbi:hypothetical protein [Trabulsiella odontotermitis]|uniref:Lipoprotein n=1 Tax=Trabulsiella odontotermitis TaxID=379893 RepID=A0A0L0GRS2_9ENTR|nr:hypothetical protein [Trabulsiella odontotermitis]KNC91118.1 hypothetical protein GM31_02810 [Trabulsiella odontotermitis]
MKANINIFACRTLLLTAVLTMVACSGVSFTHSDNTDGFGFTNAEVQPGATVIMTYPDGSACIDTRAREGKTCQLMVPSSSGASGIPDATDTPAAPAMPEAKP